MQTTAKKSSKFTKKIIHIDDIMIHQSYNYWEHNYYGADYPAGRTVQIITPTYLCTSYPQSERGGLLGLEQGCHYLPATSTNRGKG